MQSQLTLFTACAMWRQLDITTTNINIGNSIDSNKLCRFRWDVSACIKGSKDQSCLLQASKALHHLAGHVWAAHPAIRSNGLLQSQLKQAVPTSLIHSILASKHFPSQKLCLQGTFALSVAVPDTFDVTLAGELVELLASTDAGKI